jgi:hypothetical protein
MTFDDDDPLREKFPVGDGNRDGAWRNADGALAKKFYDSLPVGTKFVFDLLIDHPGENLTSDWIAAQITQHGLCRTRASSRQLVKANLKPAGQQCAASNRRLPFTCSRKNRQTSLYKMESEVAGLFREARAKSLGTQAGEDNEQWNPSEIAEVIEDYLAMLRVKIAGQRCNEGDHFDTLLSRLGPSRTAIALKFKYQNISAAMRDLGLPYLHDYKPRGNHQVALADEIRGRLEADPQLERVLKANANLGPASRSWRILSRIRAPWLYDHLRGPAQGVKVLLQMIVGIVGAIIVIVSALGDIHAHTPPVDVGHHVLAVIAVSLAVAASLELAYTLFTPGPDEAVDPLMLGISAVFLYLVSKQEEFTWTIGVAATLFAVTLGILFAVRQRFIDDDDVREGQFARLAALKPEVQAAMEESQAQAALDLLLIAEFAWHDRYGELGMPKKVTRQILRGSQQQLDHMITLIRVRLEDQEATLSSTEIAHESRDTP